MTLNGGGTIPLEKLRGVDDYHNWKFSMRNLLILEDLWECVESITVAAADKKKDQKALAKICLAIQAPAFPFVRNAVTSYEAWNNLKRAYEDRGLCRRLNLLRSLFSVKLVECESMESYVSKVTNLAQQLNDIGSPLEDDFVGVIMLSGLTADFDPLIMALENSHVKLGSETIKAKLLHETQRRGDKSESDSATALATKKVLKCFKCKKPGHFMRDCPLMKSEGKQKIKDNTSNEALLTALSVSVGHDVWCVDSGATHHMCNNRKQIHNFVYSSPVDVRVANGETLTTGGHGQVKVQLKNCSRTIENVYYVPNLTANLLSVSAMASKGYKIVFTDKICKVYSGSDIIATARQCNGVYQLDTVHKPICYNAVPDKAIESSSGKGSGNPITISQVSADVMLGQAEAVEETASPVTTGTTNPSQVVWHRRLGHLNNRSMYVLRKGMVSGINYNDNQFQPCIACIEGKQARLPFPVKSQSRAKEILGLVHTDLCGPMPMPSFRGSRYFMTFIDDYSRKTFVYFLQTKDEVFETFKHFKALVENETNMKIKIIRSDNGAEYMNSKFQEYLKQCGIRHHTTVPYSPQQNGVAERANRTIMEKARCMLMDAHLDKRFWAEAVNTAVYLKNRSPTKAVFGATPEEKWTNKKVNVSHLRTFGCLAYNHVPNTKKLDSKSKKYIFVGYCEETKGYRLIDPLYPTKCVKARNVIFIEDKCHSEKSINNEKDTKYFMSSSNYHKTNNVACETITDSESPNENGGDIEPVLYRNNRRETLFSVDHSDKTATSFMDDPADETYVPGTSLESESFNYEDCDDSFEYANMTRVALSNDPMTVNDALTGDDAEKWQAAMETEYESFLKNDCWTLVDRPVDKKPVKCKWVFKRKRDLNGEVLRYKARLVAKGFTQKSGIDYQETFSPVVRYSTIRMLLALAVEYDMNIDHLDVTTAFLNGELQENVLMEQPEGFVKEGNENKVYKLNKAIYGLKQAAKSWYEKINGVLVQKLNFKKLTLEPCVYYKTIDGKIIFITLYVDDILLFTTCSAEETNKLKDILMSEFDMKDLGPASHILGMRIRKNNGQITLDQTGYINSILERFQMSDCNPAKTPMECGLKLTKSSVVSNKYDYRNLLGCLMYVAVCTRPDIAHAVSLLSQFNESFDESHWKAAKRVLRYLKGTIDYSLVFKKGGLNISAYIDADWAASEIDRRSYTGYVFKIGKNVVSWESRKQRTVALSSTEAEYMALSEACKEALFMHNFIYESLGVKICPITMYNDNQSAQKLCTNQMFHARTKHIDIRHHFIRENVNKGMLCTVYCPTEEMTADIFTKSLSVVKHCKFVNDLNLQKV